MAELIDELRTMVRGAARVLILLVAYCLISWPFGGPFTLAHRLLVLFANLGRVLLGWAGFPEVT